jgi:capsular polysaccharide biosynthesis protein
MKNDKVLIKDLFQIINSYKFKILCICLFTVAFFVQMTFWIEKRYVSTFEINVYSKYFQNPLVSAVIPDVYNIPEMRFAIDSMVKEAINDEFIDQLGTSYNIYSITSDEREMATQRQFMRDRFSYYSTGGQSYQISFSHSDPYVAKDITAKTLKKVKDHIINKRIQTIELVKQVMIRKLNSFNASQKITQQGSDKALASKSPDVLQEELGKIINSISALSKQYKETHPKIQGLKQRKETVENWLKEFDMKDSVSDGMDLAVAVTHDKVISEQLSSKFYAKYHDFNIALDIEKRSIQTYIGTIKEPQLPTAPVWPKKRLFASLGFVLGLVFSFIYVFISEVVAPNTREKLQAEAEDLSTLILGTLPRLKNRSSVPAKRNNLIRSRDEVTLE